jgi:hypothetical protein
MKYPQFWLNASPKRKRIYSTVFILLIALLTTVAGMFVQLPPDEAQAIYTQLNQTQSSPNLAPDIFINNFSLCLLMFIPLAGLGIGLFILFSTGMAFRAIFDIQAANGLTSTATASNLTASTAIGLLLLIGAVFVLEYVSYTLAMTESVWLFRRILQKRWREVKITLALIGLVALLLAIGAIVETYAIQLPL